RPLRGRRSRARPHQGTKRRPGDAGRVGRLPVPLLREGGAGRPRAARHLWRRPALRLAPPAAQRRPPECAERRGSRRGGRCPGRLLGDARQADPPPGPAWRPRPRVLRRGAWAGRRAVPRRDAAACPRATGCRGRGERGRERGRRHSGVLHQRTPTSRRVRRGDPEPAGKGGKEPGPGPGECRARSGAHPGGLIAARAILSVLTTEIGPAMRLLLIPLDEAIVFPGVTASLPVDAEGEDRVFLLPRQNGDFGRIGVVAEVIERGQLPNGAQVATVVGLHRGLAGAAEAAGEQLHIDVQEIHDGNPADERTTELVQEYRAVVEEILELRGADERVGMFLRAIDDPGTLADTIGYSPDLSREQKLKVLETVDVKARLELAIELQRERLAELQVRRKIRDDVES